MCVCVCVCGSYSSNHTHTPTFFASLLCPVSLLFSLICFCCFELSCPILVRGKFIEYIYSAHFYQWLCQLTSNQSAERQIIKYYNKHLKNSVNGFYDIGLPGTEDNDYIIYIKIFFFNGMSTSTFDYL